MNYQQLIAAALISLGCAQAKAAHFSDLIIVQQAAQTGLWTSDLSGQMADGRPVPKKTETMCATKAEILQNFNHAMYYDTKTGKEQKAAQVNSRPTPQPWAWLP